MTYVKHELYKIRNTKFGYEWKIMTLERQKKKKKNPHGVIENIQV